MEIDCIDLTKDDDNDFRVPSIACSSLNCFKSQSNISINSFQSNCVYLCPSHYSLAVNPVPCFVCHCNISVPVANPSKVQQPVQFWRPFVDNPAEKQTLKKSRNPWGPMSYADLITKAILSSPKHRLTLTQIYDWFVENVPYFSDKGETNSSIGWKNSIRHNLSLHKRFVRMDSNGGVKSSFWTVDLEQERLSKTKYKKTNISVESNNSN